MDDAEKLLKGTVGELEKLLNARNVLGDPIDRDGATVIPIVSYGFGFGAGGSAGTKPGSGTGAGGGIKPIGAIIFDKDGARVESVRGPIGSLAEVIGAAATKVVEQVGKREGKAEKAEKAG